MTIIVQPAGLNERTLTLDATSGRSKIKVWDAPTKGRQVSLPKTWRLDRDTVPGTLYVEGVNASAALQDITLSLTFNGEGDVIHEDSVKVTVGSLNLTIHKPPVIDSGETAIPEADELEKGAQTFVNLDNDDGDNSFDTGTSDTTVGGENEMTQLTLELKPAGLTGGNVRLSEIAGAGDVKIWKARNKNNMEYMLGSNLPVSGFILGRLNLWVEGIKPHATQQGTKLKMTYDRLPNAVDEVALTIIGIEEIKWKGQNNSRNDNDILDTDPNHKNPDGTAVSPAAVRVFPDARVVGGAVEADPRDTVDVEVTLSVKPVEDVTIFFDSFDVDDPTANMGPVDDEADPEDNRGATVELAGTGQFTEGEDGAGILKKTFTNKTETLEFRTTMRPGDNFRVVGNGDRDFITDLENRDSALGAANADKLRIVNRGSFPVGTAAVEQEIREATKYASIVLTVWRFLHVERDSMGAVTGNQVTGNITALTPPSTGTAIRVAVDNNLNDGSAIPTGRFENGTMTVAGVNPIRNLTRNTASTVARTTGMNITSTPLPFFARDNDTWTLPETMSGTVTSIISAGGWVLKLNVTASSDTPIDWEDFKGGTIRIGGGTAMGITDGFRFTTSVGVRGLRIPYTMVDDDVISGDVPAPDTAGMMTTYAPAYILPLFDTGEDTPDVPFVLNSENADIRAHIEEGKGVDLSTDRHWAVTVLGAYQRLRARDNDPNSEGTPRARAIGVAHGALVAMESIRDWIQTPPPSGGGGMDPAVAGRQPRGQEILNHEVGHLFGLRHPDGSRVLGVDPQGGVMNPTTFNGIPDKPAAGSRGASTFTQVSLDKLRHRAHPGN